MTNDSDDYLNQVLIGGRELISISVVDYDEQWPLRFRNTAECIHQVLGALAPDVEHIGSTSVPGLAAKPIIDILLTVDDITDESAYVPPLESIGLVLRVREPEHRMLRTPARDMHVHVFESSHPQVRDYLDLRDWLRVSPEDRELYARTKRKLAARGYRDMNHYADAKTEVVLKILSRARTWRISRSTPLT